MKHKIFNVKDFLTFGLGTIITIVVAVFASFRDNPVMGLIITWLVAAVFAGGYGMLLYWRYKIKKNEKNNERLAEEYYSENLEKLH